MWITTAVGSKLHVWTTQKQSRTGIKSLRTPGRRKLRCCSDTLHGIGVKKQTFNITLGTYMQIIFSNDMFVIKSFWRNELKSVLWVWLGHLLHSRNWQNTVNYILIKKFLNVLWNFRILSSFSTPVTFALFQFILVPWFSLGGWRGWMGNGLTLTSTTSCKIRKSTGLGVRRPR